MQPDEIVTPEILADLEGFVTEEPSAAFADHIVSYYGPVLQDIGFDISTLALWEIYWMSSAVTDHEIVKRKGGWVRGNDITLEWDEYHALRAVANAARGR